MNQQAEPVEYLRGIISRYSIPDKENDAIFDRCKPILGDIKVWASEVLSRRIRIQRSGSFAKGTAVSGAVDIDFLVSFGNQSAISLEEIYESLYQYLNERYETRKQNVSIGVSLNQIKIDIVPAQQWINTPQKHSLYVRKDDTRKMTDIDVHIETIKKQSIPIKNVIKLVKIWRNLHKSEFPSFLIELVVLKVLEENNIGRRIDKGFLQILNYLQKDFCGARIVDPANSNNIVSDTISASEKDTIRKLANESLKVDCWEQIVWGLYPIIRS